MEDGLILINNFKYYLKILTKFIKLYYDQGNAKNRWC